MDENINEECKHYFLGYCHIYLGGMCSNIECEYKPKQKTWESILIK